MHNTAKTSHFESISLTNICSVIIINYESPNKVECILQQKLHLLLTLVFSWNDSRSTATTSIDNKHWKNWYFSKTLTWTQPFHAYVHGWITTNCSESHNHFLACNTIIPLSGEDTFFDTLFIVGYRFYLN